jgi:hypothetical protein
VSDCCTPKGYPQIFSERNAAGEAKHYRRKGLDGTCERILDFISERGVEGKTLLEVGGGIGAIEIELLKAEQVARRRMTKPTELAPWRMHLIGRGRSLVRPTGRSQCQVCHVRP